MLTPGRPSGRLETQGASVLPALLDLAGEGVVLHRLDGTVADWTPRAARLLGVTPERLEGSRTLLPDRDAIQEDGRPLSPEDEPAPLALRTACAQRDRVVRLRADDGAATWLVLSAAPLMSADGKDCVGALSVIRDVTEEREAVRRNAGVHRMEAIGRLAGGVAHDFNNLLTAIIGYNDLLLDKLDPADSRRHAAEQVQRVAERASDLTHQLLAFSRRQHLELRILDLNELLDGVRPLLDHLLGPRVRLRYDTAVAVGPVRADRAQLERVVMNLALNARDAMPDGGEVHFATDDVVLDQGFEDAHPGSRAGRCVLLTVTDTGHGMDAETLRHIFEPFFTTKPHDKGTGLGLSTVYGIVKQCGGFIDVESASGRGSTFRIYLPRCDAVTEGSMATCRAELPGRDVGTPAHGER